MAAITRSRAKENVMGESMEWSTRTRKPRESLPLRGAACVIEPNEDDRDGVSSLLRHMGFATHETPNGAVGALIAEQIDLSVIVIDVMLQDVPALRLIKQLRAKAPGAVIIALTPDPRGLTLAHVAGADAVLASPPCGEALCATITGAPALARQRGPGKNVFRQPFASSQKFNPI
jgi:DNA-binding response OmpR family regulator